MTKTTSVTHGDQTLSIGQTFSVDSIDWTITSFQGCSRLDRGLRTVIARNESHARAFELRSVLEATK